MARAVRRTAHIAVPVVLLATPCGHGQERRAAHEATQRRFGVVLSEDVEYARVPVRAPRAHEKPLLLDVYVPKDAPGRRPAFMAIHGGGLRRGDKRDENMAELCRELSSRGFVCVSMNYRMIPHGAADGAVEPAAALALARRAAQAGLHYELHLCEGLGHTVPLDRRPQGRSLYARLSDFLARAGTGRGGATSFGPQPLDERSKPCPH